MSNIEIAKPRDFGEIISDTFAFIRQNFKPLLKYFFIFCGFFIVASITTTVLVEIRAIGIVNNYDANNYDSATAFSGVFPLFANLFLTLIFIMLEYLMITLTVLSFMALYKQKQNTVPTTAEMWGYIKFYFWRVLGASFVISIVVALGTVLCIIPGIYLYPIMMLVTPIMIIENASFGYAFNQSFRLIRDNWWVTFGVMVVIGIILYVASLIVTVPATILNAGNMFMHITKGIPVTLPLAILSSILQEISHVFHIITVVAVALCYYNLHESKEGTTLNERISQFGLSTPESDTAPEEY